MSVQQSSLRPERLLPLTLCVSQAVQRSDWRTAEALVSERSRLLSQLISEGAELTSEELASVRAADDALRESLENSRRQVLKRLSEIRQLGKARNAYKKC